jgi:hypothetical protein
VVCAALDDPKIQSALSGLMARWVRYRADAGSALVKGEA